MKSVDSPSAGRACGHAAAVATNPINKDALYRAGFHQPGHTEYLAELARELERERQQALAEAGSLLSYIDHIKAVVKTQQSYARGSPEVVDGPR